MDLGDIRLELEDKYKDMMIRTPWGYFDDLAADAAENGIILTAPAGFKKWNSGYSRGAFYACRLHSEDGEVALMFSPIEAIDHLRIFDVRGEKMLDNKKGIFYGVTADTWKLWDWKVPLFISPHHK